MNQCPWEGKHELQLMNCWSIRTNKSDKNYRGMQSLDEPPHFLVLPVGVLKFSFVLLAEGREKELCYNMTGHSVLLSEACPQEKLTYHQLTCQVSSESNLPKGKDIHNSSLLQPSAIVSHLRMGSKGVKLRSTNEVHSPGTGSS